MESLYAVLAGEPLCLPFEVIGKLTDRQIYDVLLYPRDEKGQLKLKRVETTFPDLEPTRANQRMVLFNLGRAAGIKEDELEQVWKERHGA